MIVGPVKLNSFFLNILNLIISISTKYMLSNIALPSGLNQRPLHPSLQAKLQLLENLQKGNIGRVRELAYALSKVGRTNPQLYGKLSSFVEQHQEQLLESDSDNEDQQPEIINVEDDFVEGKEWNSDDSIDYDSEEEEEDADKQNMAAIQVKKQGVSKVGGHKKQLFKEIKGNCERRSVSNKKINASTPNNTHQFKPSVVAPVKKESQAKGKGTVSKPQVHKNSAIGKTKNSIQH